MIGQRRVRRSAVLRGEDRGLLTGVAAYLEDVADAGALHVGFVRSALSRTPA